MLLTRRRNLADANVKGTVPLVRKRILFAAKVIAAHKVIFVADQVKGKRAAEDKNLC